MTPRAIVLTALLTLPMTAGHAQQPASPIPRHPPVTKAEADRWMTELSNWGRWGKDDQLGALNLITAEKRRQAMALAKTGTVVSLERPIVPSKAPDETKADGKPHGIAFFDIRFKTFSAGDPRGNDGFSSDIQESHVHGGMTHLDALCHDSSDGKLYNGYPLESVSQEIGCTKLGLDNVKEGIVTRGILIDMTRLKSPRSRGAGARGDNAARVYVEDIEAWEKQTGLKVSAGDALFVYNPRGRTASAQPPGPAGGFDLSVVPWMKARGVAVTSNVMATADDRHADHRLVLVALGTYLLDGVALDNLAETAARLNRWEFMLVVAPLQVPGSTGSIVNPLAMF
jgi:kynurenine formamidase